ncbi:MAG: hypothetical protein KH544_00020 [Firmicutes bacterium]|nr:hypothetical protein [Bacillota bacterium]
MSYENWKDKAQGFQTMDVRHIQGSFFEGLKKRAEALEVGEGLHSAVWRRRKATAPLPSSRWLF